MMDPYLLIHERDSVTVSAVCRQSAAAALCSEIFGSVKRIGIYRYRAQRNHVADGIDDGIDDGSATKIDGPARRTLAMSRAKKVTTNGLWRKLQNEQSPLFPWAPCRSSLCATQYKANQ
jgi:hypothetical protein